MTSNGLSYQVVDHVAEITLTRPGCGNAIDLDLYRNLCTALERAGADPGVRAILLSGSGDDFSVGEDMDYLATLERTGRHAEWTHGYRGWIPVTWHNPKFVVAAVRGRALGIGCELALLSDVTFAARDACFGHPETRIGIITHTVWPWLVGAKVAKEYLATGAVMNGTVAQQKGLINAAVEPGDLDARVRAFVADLASMPDGTPGANKKRINWAFRDISRVLHDDRQYDVDFEWGVAARKVDAAFYNSVKEAGVAAAVRARDHKFNAPRT